MNHRTDPVYQLVELVATRLEGGQPTTIINAAEALGWSKGTCGNLFAIARSRHWLDDSGVPTQAGLEVIGRV